MKLGLQLWNVFRDFGPPPLGETPGKSRGSWGRAGPLTRGVAAAILSLVTACGYRPIYGGAEHDRYQVVTTRYATAQFEAVQATAAGVRSELSAAEALGSGFPQVVVEVLRVDERSIGVRSMGNEGPLARGTEIIVVGRAQVVPRAGEPPTTDTGDMSRAAQYAAGASPTANAAARSRAVRDAARNLGKALGRAILGLPEPAEG